MRGLLLCTAAGVFVVDVVTKSVAVGVLDPGDRVPVAGDAVAWLLIRNPGAAFSWGADSTIYLTVALAAIVGVVAGVAALAWRQLAGPSLPHAERYGWDADDRF
jgi:signal peptidase II